MKITLALISIFTIAALVLGGCAHRYKTPEQRADYFTEKIAKKLDLNDEQKVKLDMMKDELLAVREEMQGKREEARNTVHDLLSAPVIDQDKAVALVNSHVEDISAQAPRIIAALAGFWESLTPEQQTKVREKLEKHFENNGRWSHSRLHYM
ncbi:MAG: Spy/CpxP family protein refolding chaperone [Candidatus Thiodiazotropha sp. (ex Monitilora ramsayi)]|nr:Spy/CpxP family protein refolding chaperone [Candidatus Thiodiazotropha sp. (ex Monitilora ramsayi)]